MNTGPPGRKHAKQGSLSSLGLPFSILFHLAGHSTVCSLTQMLCGDGKTSPQKLVCLNMPAITRRQEPRMNQTCISALRKRLNLSLILWTERISLHILQPPSCLPTRHRNQRRSRLACLRKSAQFKWKDRRSKKNP